MNTNIENLVLQLFEIGAVKFGSFELKSGIISPIYIDLRVIVSYPKVLGVVADLMWNKIADYDFDIICGVPYTALPMATAISLKYDKPMVMRRKEAKDYGTKKIIEGHFLAKQKCLIIEDLITSGMSIFETIEPLEREGLLVKDIVVLLNREQGGEENLESKGYHLTSVLSMTELLNILLEQNKIDEKTFAEINNFIKQNQIKK